MPRACFHACSDDGPRRAAFHNWCDVRSGCFRAAPPAIRRRRLIPTILQRPRVAKHRPAARRAIDCDPGVKGRPREGYFGATGGGLWKTTDGGATWIPVTDGQVHSSSVGAVAVSESNPDIVFIGMGESCIRGNIQPGDGVYKSTDAGKTWTHVGFSASQAISKIRIHPTNPQIVYVAVVRPLRRAQRRARHLQEHRRRRDVAHGCSSATRRPAASTSRSIRDNPNVIFAALWEAYRVEYQMSSGGPGSGLFKSTDGGEHWTEITRNPGLPRGVDRQDRRRHLRAPIRIASTRSSRTKTAGCSAPTTPAARGSW